MNSPSRTWSCIVAVLRRGGRLAQRFQALIDLKENPSVDFCSSCSTAIPWPNLCIVNMDPLSIVSIVSTAVSLGDVILRCITGLSALKTKYHDAPLTITTIVGQLYMVQAALTQLSTWNRPEHCRSPRYRQLASQADDALGSFGPLMLALENQLDHLDSPSVTTKTRLEFLWNESEMTNYSVLLDRQVNALNLLLQAVQW
jgi:hypothetical protein